MRPRRSPCPGNGAGGGQRGPGSDVDHRTRIAKISPGRRSVQPSPWRRSRRGLRLPASGRCNTGGVPPLLRARAARIRARTRSHTKTIAASRPAATPPVFAPMTRATVTRPIIRTAPANATSANRSSACRTRSASRGRRSPASNCAHAYNSATITTPNRSASSSDHLPAFSHMSRDAPSRGSVPREAAPTV
jgi:hypothetical protein